MGGKYAGLLVALAVFLLIPSASSALSPPLLGSSTLQQTIPRPNGEVFAPLHAEPGEPRVLRTEDGLGGARPGREQRRDSLLYFAQLSDLHVTDNESPVRVEALAPLGGMFASAWRPQEALSPFWVDAMIRQVNAFTRSPVPMRTGARAKLALAMLTGDVADNDQLNEAHWARRLIEGGNFQRDPAPAQDEYKDCPPDTPKLPDPAQHYFGIQNYTGPIAISGFPNFYNPDNPSQFFAAWPRYPGLLDRAKRGFKTPGLAVPSYIVVGNHDRLLSGQLRGNALIDAGAIGCVKPINAKALLYENKLPDFKKLFRYDPTTSMLVPPDRRRHLMTEAAFRAAFAGGRQADGHGFAYVDKDELRTSNGAASYYAWDPKPGFRFIVLNSVSQAGLMWVSSSGRIDDPQYRWLERELRAASAANKLIVVFSHHDPDMSAQAADETAPACRPRGDPDPGCDADPRDSRPLHFGADIVRLLQGYPHVIAWVSGHDHANGIDPYVQNGHGFWAIRTASEIDWPSQSRLLEVADNHDGTLSIFSTILDTAAPVDIPASGSAASTFSDVQLASIARAFTYNDHRIIDWGHDGRAIDRNVELLINDPRRH